MWGREPKKLRTHVVATLLRICHLFCALPLWWRVGCPKLLTARNKADSLRASHEKEEVAPCPSVENSRGRMAPEGKVSSSMWAEEPSRLNLSFRVYFICFVPFILSSQRHATTPTLLMMTLHLRAAENGAHRFHHSSSCPLLHIITCFVFFFCFLMCGGVSIVCV